MIRRYDGMLVGGNPALDFLNTVHDWTVDQPNDYLATFDHALGFGHAVGLINRSEERRLDGRRAGTELRRLRGLRKSLERIFRASVSRRSPPSHDLAVLVAALAEGTRGMRLRGTRGGPLRREIGVERSGAALLRLRVAEVAATLLTSADLERVKACPTCGWFFLDTSKNRSRRWCSMSTCGASAKSRTYYRRTRGRRRLRR